MTYNKINLAIAKIASKDNNRPELSSVFFTRNKTVATNSYMLLEVSIPTAEPNIAGAMQSCNPFLVSASDIIKIKSESVAIKHIDAKAIQFIADNQIITIPRIDGQFPDYDKIFPQGKPKAEVIVNAKYLRTLLENLGKLSDNITIKIHGDDKPVVLTASYGNHQFSRALLIPVKK